MESCRLPWSLQGVLWTVDVVHGWSPFPWLISSKSSFQCRRYGRSRRPQSCSPATYCKSHTGYLILEGNNKPLYFTDEWGSMQYSITLLMEKIDKMIDIITSYRCLLLTLKYWERETFCLSLWWKSLGWRVKIGSGNGCDSSSLWTVNIILCSRIKRLLSGNSLTNIANKTAS